MFSYCLTCRKNTESKNLKVSRVSDEKIMLLSGLQCPIAKKSIFVNKQKANCLLSQLRIRTPLSKMPSLGDIVFREYKNQMQ